MSGNFFSSMPRLVPILPGQMGSVRKAAEDDGHALLLPTHAVVRGEGRVVDGAFSVGAWRHHGRPVVTMWLHSTRVSGRGSFGLINAVENMVFGSGATAGYVLVEEDSPFYAVMEGLGFENLGEHFLRVGCAVEDAGVDDVELVLEDNGGAGWPMVLFGKDL